MKNFFNQTALLFLVFILAMNNIDAQTPITPEALYSQERLSGFSISPDGKFVLTLVAKPNLETNKMESYIHVVSTANNTESPIVIQDEASVSEPIWHPNGNGFAYIKIQDNAYHIYFTGTKADGDRLMLMGMPKRVASFKEDISSLQFSPDGKYFSFVKNVKVEQTPAEKYPKLAKANVRIYDSLPIRAWDVWVDENVPHIFYMPFDGTANEAKDIMTGYKFKNIYGYSWSPDSKEIAYSMKKVSGVAAARSTNSDVYVYNLQSQSVVDITDGMKGYDNSPKYSPDGKFISFCSQERAGFESDRIKLMIYDRVTKEIKEISKGFDQWVTEYIWMPDSKSIYLTATNKGCYSIFKINIEDNNKITEISQGQYDYSTISLTNDGRTLCFGRCNMLTPIEIYTMNVAELSSANSDVKQITNYNGTALKQFAPSSFEEKWIKTKDGKQLHCWIVYPPNFDKSKKYPTITYCQGGPQQMISQAYGYRWNMSLLSAKGYIIVAPNRRGCPGFGQNWIDAITHDWGGKPMQDILDATDEMSKQPYVDKNKLVAIGASAGGFTAFWLAGNHKNRFKALLSHCGVFNFYSMYGSTEELFFPDWEWGGAYWEGKNKSFYDKHSPHNFIANWNTPIVISTGERDFRVPYSQSLEAFTAAQLKGVPSKLLVYPEMNHFVGKSQEYIIWYNEVFDFFDKHLK